MRLVLATVVSAAAVSVVGCAYDGEPVDGVGAAASESPSESSRPIDDEAARDVSGPAFGPPISPEPVPPPDYGARTELAIDRPEPSRTRRDVEIALAGEIVAARPDVVAIGAI